MKKVFDNKKTLTKRQVREAKIGGVFIVNDKIVFNHKGKEKPRRVVLVGKRGNSVIVAPIRHRPPGTMEVSRFDGNRCIRLDKSVLISKNKVYSKNSFKGTHNDYLTKHEKVLLIRKILGYK